MFFRTTVEPFRLDVFPCALTNPPIRTLYALDQACYVRELPIHRSTARVLALRGSEVRGLPFRRGRCGKRDCGFILAEARAREAHIITLDVVSHIAHGWHGHCCAKWRRRSCQRGFHRLSAGNENVRAKAAVALAGRMATVLLAFCSVLSECFDALARSISPRENKLTTI